MDIVYDRTQFELPDGTTETCIAAEKHGVEASCGVHFFAAQLARGPWTVVHMKYWRHSQYKRIDPLPLFDTPEEAVEKMLTEDNLRVEVKDERGRWTEAGPETL